MLMQLNIKGASVIENIREMDFIQTLYMNKGTGKNSYAKNSTTQNDIISQGNLILDEAVKECLRKTQPVSMGIADLGCGSGPNSFTVISHIINTVRSETGSSLPELKVSLNDLPQNDFNDLIMSLLLENGSRYLIILEKCITIQQLPGFYDNLQKEKGIGLGGCLVSVVAGSFYGRLFPKNSLHFVHSSSSLHWLSQVPRSLRTETGRNVHKGNIYISDTSPDRVVKAYMDQFRRDFSAFLKLRAEEIVCGGGMVLSFMGKLPNKLGCPQWELLSQALISMASQGLVEEEKIDAFNAPYYAPSAEEVRSVIKEEGSFTINNLKAFEIEWVQDCANANTLSKGERVAVNMRVVIESMLGSHFGTQVMDDLFARYGKLFDEYLLVDGTKLVNLVVSVTKK